MGEAKQSETLTPEKALKIIQDTTQTCPHCKTPGLKWRRVNNTWRLFEPDNDIHFCPTYTSRPRN